jgi:hypothetical protein
MFKLDCDLQCEHIYIPVIAIMLICGLTLPSYEISRGNFTEHPDIGGITVVLAFSIIGMIVFIILSIFWLKKKYEVNEALYSMNEIFLQNQMCEDTPLIYKQKDDVVSNE